MIGPSGLVQYKNTTIPTQNKTNLLPPPARCRSAAQCSPVDEQSLAGEGLAVLVQRTAERLGAVAERVDLEQRVAQVLAGLLEEQREEAVRQREAADTRRLAEQQAEHRRQWRSAGIISVSVWDSHTGQLDMNEAGNDNVAMSIGYNRYSLIVNH